VLVGPSYTLTCCELTRRSSFSAFIEMLTCPLRRPDRLEYKQMRERWEWKLGGEEVGGAESKFQFVFAEKRKEGRKEG
jgi:hypothetical protein